VNPLLRFCSSSIGRKWIVALTGLVLFAFVVGHLLGNLQIFLGSPEPINRYGAFLQGLGELLWVIRAGLLLMLVLHVVFTIQLRLESRAARGVPYAVTQHRATSPAARWMLLSGVMVFCFIIFHLLHFTVQVPEVNMVGRNFEKLTDAAGRHDVYRMMVLGFSNPVASAFYLVGVALLALHLSHGIMSMFQTLGLNSAKVRPLWEKGGPTVAWLIFLGYASIPLAVLTGIVK
jgi:succinate dehydrogenase / fumarate reductase cytochrome b subunit